VNDAEPDQPPESSASDDADLERIRALPKEVGVLLLVAGLGGLVLPGPFGTPLIVLGGVVVWPKAFGRVESYFRKKCPKLHHKGLRQINRFLTDLDRRYPLPK
jgi:hypothetical protein